MQHHSLAQHIKPTTLSLKSFTADRIKTYGEIKLTVSLAGQSNVARLIVTDMVDTHCLLGYDFLHSNRMEINFNKQSITSPSGSVGFLKQHQQLKKPSTIRCSKTVSIPANTVKFLRAKATGLNGHYSHTGFVEPKLSLLSSSNLMVQSNLCHADGRDIPVKIVNLSDEPVTVFKNKVLGTLHPLETNCDYNIRKVTVAEDPTPEWRRTAVNEIILEEKSGNTDDPWTRSRLFTELRIDEISGISNDNIHRLKEIIWKYRDCFSRGPFDLGECTAYSADITLKRDYKPTWVPARPIPIS